MAKKDEPKALPVWIQALQLVLILAIFWTLFRDAYNVAPDWARGMVNALSWVFFVQVAPPYILNYVEYLKQKWREPSGHTKKHAGEDADRVEATAAPEPAEAD